MKVVVKILGVIASITDRNQWSCDNKSALAVLKDSQDFLSETVVVGGVPHPEYLYALKMIERLGGQIVSVDDHEPEVEPDGRVY